MLKILGIAALLLLFTGLLAACAASTSSSTPESTGILQITVMDTENKPLAGAKVVSDLQPEGQLKVSGISGNDGLVTFSAVKPGEYQFSISRADHQGMVLKINVVAGQTIGISANLPSQATSP